jgi:hypothetical protein
MHRKLHSNWISTIQNIRSWFIKIKLRLLVFYYTQVNTLSEVIYKLLYGRRLGDYYNNRLYDPTIILNNTILGVIDTKPEKWEFYSRIFSDINWDTKEVLYQAKLKELLNGKSFPLESPFYPQTKMSPREFRYPDNFPDSLKYRKTTLPFDFTFQLYQEWEKDSDFLTYCVIYYLENYILNIEDDLLGFDFFYNNLLYSEHLTLDLTPLFIYQEQADSVAAYLKSYYKDSLPEASWGQTFINNLYQVKLPKKNS